MPIVPAGGYVAPERIAAAIVSRPFYLRLLRGLRRQRRYREARQMLAELRIIKEWESVL